jgi:cephalosporin hydroxylase
MAINKALKRLAGGSTAGQAVNDFHRLYYDSGVYRHTFWRGVETQKCPLDLWIYQEILHELKPDVVVETGTFSGGSAYYMASLFDLFGKGKVVTVDLEPQPNLPIHPRITYISGLSSTAPEAVSRVRALIEPGAVVMVILDSDHSKRHVLDELRLYAGMVTPGQYLIVEDTNINGHPALPEFGPGPMEAVDDFLKETSSFEVDAGREKFYMTFNPRGYLRRR